MNVQDEPLAPGGVWLALHSHGSLTAMRREDRDG